MIEPGETVVLPVTAHNNGTAPVTGMSAVLSTTTPGVTITDNAATFADMAADAVAVSNPNHFSFFVDPSFPCGGTIDFTIQFTTHAGDLELELHPSDRDPGLDHEHAPLDRRSEDHLGQRHGRSRTSSWPPPGPSST